MSIICHELKKIFHWKKVLILTGICLIIFQMFIQFYFIYFPNGSGSYDYDISVQMIKDYGNTMEVEEYDHFKGLYQQNVELANQYIQSTQRFARAGITSFPQLQIEIEADPNSPVLINLWKLGYTDQYDLFMVLQTMDMMMESYERYFTNYYLNITPSQEQRLQEVQDQQGYAPIFPEQVFRNYQYLIYYTAVVILISIMFMITPIFISDRRKKLHYIQYTSKLGRKLFTSKLWASLIAVFLIITVELGCIFVLYAGNKTDMFFASNVNSVFNYHVFWYDITFFQYILMTVAVIYILGLFITTIVAFLSSVTVHYITILGILVPLAYLMFGVGLTYLLEWLSDTRLPQWFQPLCFIGLVAVGILIIMFRWRKEKVADIVG
ncbi:hypothetical protein J2T13_001901 [Paenibacillus sp. DS2015]|uniref:hypothetical protein n=1 Tax=Paenibacillus sp. DS2015 TaxID=3373917 RepID=UPI003D24C77C